MAYSYRKLVLLSLSEAVEKTKGELQREGFGVLTEIDVKETLKKKLNVEYDNYIILGACNPPFAYKALQTEKEVGLLMPCNLIVYEDQGRVFVSTILPMVTMKITNNPRLKTIADKVEKKLKLVVDRI